MKKILLLLSLVSIQAFGQIEKVEPPFWWSKMNHSDVEIMFYGKNIAQNEIMVSNDFVIKNIRKTENPNYVFITIDTKNKEDQDFIFTFKNKKKEFTQKYSLKKRRENTKFKKSFNSSDLIYLVVPDRFANGNTQNDNTLETIEKSDRKNKDGRHGGDIQGIIDHLDYIKELGATTLWSTPLCEDNDEKGSYHTYGQSDVYKIDSRFGTNDDYVRLSKELHNRDMKLILDYVTNHWGYKHWMMADLPTYDWLHQFPGYKQTNYRMPTQFDTNASDIDRTLCTDGWFVKSMPDLNQSNPLVLNYLIQNAIWWVEFADIDGLRVDTYPYTDKKSIAIWTKALIDEYPNINITGETWLYNHAQIAFWQKDSKIGAIESYNSYLPNVMDFMLQNIFANGVFNEDEATWSQGIIKLYDTFTNDFLFPDINNVLIFADNHDTNRINDTYKGDLRKYKMTMAVLATTRGVPQIYQGSEIGMSGSKSVGDGDIRQDFPGGWDGDQNNAFTKSGRTATQQQFFDFTSKLFTWRKSKSVIHSGKLKHYLPNNNVYVYFRYNEQESVMVVINNSKDKQSFKTDRFQENLQNYTMGTDVITNKTVSLQSEIEMEAKSVLILELK